MVNAHTWGINSAWAIFLAYYLSASSFPGATQFEYALIGGLSISQALLSSPLVAVSGRHLGTNVTMAIGTVLIFVSLFTASYATQIWHLFLSQGVCFGIGMGFVYIPATAVLPQWFSTKRSLAVGISTSGAGLGGVAYNLIAGAAVRNLGLQWTYRILAFTSLAVNGICAILIRDRSKASKAKGKTFDWREFGRPEVIMVIIWGFLSEIGYIVLLYSLPHFATSIGLSQGQGSVIGAIFNLGLGFGRPIIGYCSDRLGRINVAAFMTASCGIFCLAIWVPAKSYAALAIFAVLSGLGAGNFWGTVPAVTAEVVGLKRLSSAFGVICLPLVIPTTFAEAIGLSLADASGYLTSQVFVGFMFLIAASSTWLLRSWKLAELEDKALAEEQDQQTQRSKVSMTLRCFAPKRLFKLCIV
ncbi:hypothetical protein BT93_L5528 [Corymbia citriodora subsp. variegata]|uniref:Major facilitator superfamily (MFS) profile domain-containing protein n=1 Tax=Corymbia citriodora subsp. variegata TaxID=360336 RepID=A0A8T0CF13_CORYI|nr:hypothetical protein BT93_L5528 [Corymbia citriodora subsp. variegata]